MRDSDEEQQPPFDDWTTFTPRYSWHFCSIFIFLRNWIEKPFVYKRISPFYVNKRVGYEISPEAKVRRRDGKKTKGWERRYLDKGLTCSRKEQLKVSTSQGGESLRGRACGRYVGGSQRPQGSSLTTGRGGLPRVLDNCVDIPGAWPIQTTGSHLYPCSSRMNREMVLEGECVFS